LAKGGKIEDTVNRKCLCNGLVSNIGYPQHFKGGGHEWAILTLGDDYVNIGQFCKPGSLDFTAADVIRTILG
jgi:nitronate monooxygenase